MASTLVNLTRLTETIQGYQLTEPLDMFTALQYISGITSQVYSGTIDCNNTGGTVTWQLAIRNLTNSQSMFAKITDWVILENSALVSVCPAASYTVLYTPV